MRMMITLGAVAIRSGPGRSRRRLAAAPALAVLAMIVLACGGGTDSHGEPEDEALRISYRSVEDPLAGDIESFRYLAPEGWEVIGPGVVWNVGLRNGGVSASLDVGDPEQPRGFAYLPYLPYHWSEPQPFGIGEGQVYSVLGSVTQRPLTAVEYLETIAIPGNFPGLTRVVGSQPLPDVAEAVRESFGLSSVDAARSRIVFENGARQLEAHVYAWISYETNTLAGLTTTLWQPELLYVVYAAPGRLDDEAPLLNTLALSYIVNPDWVAVVNQVEALRIEGTAREQELLDDLVETLRETNDAIFDYTAESFRDRQAANDRVFQNMTEAIRGTETYADPGVGNIELPGGFAEVWATGTGDWILSNDALYDPNIGSSVDWKRIRPSP